MLRYSTAIVATLVLSACGGGGGSPEVSYKAVRIFSDGSGVAVGTSDDGSKAMVLAPEIGAIVAIDSSSSDSDDLDIELEDFPIIGSTANAIIRQGAISSDGITQNLLIYETGNGEDGFAFVTMPEYGIEYYLSAGETLSNVPSGSFTYRGDQMIKSYQTSSGINQVGTAEILIDFDNKTFAYTGQTQTTSLTGSGILEPAQGRFTDVSATLNVGAQQHNATIHGLLHGNGASSATGVIHSNEATPLYGGAFVTKK